MPLTRWNHFTMGASLAKAVAAATRGSVRTRTTEVIACVDTETTGLSARADRVVSVGLVIARVDPKTGEWASLFELDEKVCPDGFVVPRSPFHDVTHELAVATGRPMAEILSRIDAALAQHRVRKVIAYNAGFDRRMLEAERGRLCEPSSGEPGSRLMAFEWTCALAATRRCRHVLDLGSSLKLVDVHAALGGSDHKAHDALQDAKAAVTVYGKVCAVAKELASQAQTKPDVGKRRQMKLCGATTKKGLPCRNAAGRCRWHPC